MTNVCYTRVCRPWSQTARMCNTSDTRRQVTCVIFGSIVYALSIFLYHNVTQGIILLTIWTLIYENRWYFYVWCNDASNNIDKDGVDMETLAAMLPPSKLAFTKRHSEFYLCSKYCVRAQLFVLTLCAWCVFHVFGCALSVYHLSSHWVRVCLLLINVVIDHKVNSKWFQISTSGTQKYPEHTLALICRAVTHGLPHKTGE